MDRALIEEYAGGGAKLRKALVGLEIDDLHAKPGPGKWSIKELVIHLADSDAISIDRMKRIIIEENPPLLYADETAYVDKLHCDDQSIEDAVLLFDVGRRQFARVLRRLSDGAFERIGTHNKKGKVALGQLVGDYVKHLDYHLQFVYDKRKNLEQPLP